MRLLLISLALALSICGSNAAGEQPVIRPVVTLSIKNYPAMLKAAGWVANAVAPGQGASLPGAFRNALGSPDLAGIDARRPWQLALWFKQMGVAPLLTLSVPVTDFATFEKGLEPGTLLRRKQSEMIQVQKQAVVIFHLGRAAVSNEVGPRWIQRWARAVPLTQKRTFRLSLDLNEAGRAQLLAVLKMARLTVGQVFRQQQKGKGGVNLRNATRMLNLEFDMMDGIVSGLDHARIEVEASPRALDVYEQVVPLKGSQLAQWLRRGPADLRGLAADLDPRAPFSLALQLSGGSATQGFFKKMMRFSLELQNKPADSKTAQAMDHLMKAMLPIVVVGSLDFGPGYRFDGFYEFPGRDTAKVYAQSLDSITNLLALQTGKDALYANYRFQRKIRRIEGKPVDRLTMTINSNAPAFQSPQQKAAIAGMFPGGKVTLDYMVRGGRLYMASGVPLEKALHPSKATFPFGVDPQTAALGEINPVAFLKAMSTFNPVVRTATASRFKHLDPTGCSMPFKVNLNGRLHCRLRIPLQCFTALSQLRSSPGQ